MLSLHVLAEPRHHALQHEWVRRMRTASPALKREIGTLSFLYRWTIPNCVLPTATAGDEDFATELAALGRMRRDLVAFELLRPLYDHGGKGPRRKVLIEPSVRAAALRRARTLGPESGRAAALLFDDPGALRDRFVALLERYWEEAFADEWERIEPRLAESVVAAGREIAGGGITRFLTGLAPQLRVDRDGRSFGLDVPHDHRVPLSPELPLVLVLVPSAYTWPHVRVNCDAPWPLTLVYRAPYLVEALKRSTPSELVHVLRALGDPTRLRILSLVAKRPRSTQELAPMAGLTEAGTSKHLRQLAEAGLLERRREGYYVVYSLLPEKLDTLSRELRHLLTQH